MPPTDVNPTAASHRPHANAEGSRHLRELERENWIFNTTLSSITDFAYILDRDSRFIYVNKPLLDLWGLTLEQAAGKDFFDLKYPDALAAKLARQVREVFESGRSLSDQTPYTSPSGVAGFYEYIFSPVVGSSGAVEAVAGSTRDVTSQKQVEEALRQSEAYLRSALDSAAGGFYGVDRDGVTTICNSEFLRMIGFERSEDAVGRKLHHVIHHSHPDGSHYPMEQCPLYRTAQTGRPAHVEDELFFRLDGSSFPVEYWSYPIIRDGEICGAVTTFIDISERKRAEEKERQAAIGAIAAAETNAKFRTFFEQGAYFAGVMAPDGTIVEANRLCLEFCGFTREDIIGKKFWECGWWCLSAELVETIRTHCAEAALGRLVRCQTKYYVADGSERVVDLTLAPVTDDAGRVLFIAPTGIDITETKRSADERERLLQAERAAHAEAEEANEAKDKFLAVLSHELRTPLSPVVMTIPAIEIDPDLPFKFREDLAMIRRNIDLEVKLIDDLLDLSRVTTGKLRLDMQSVHAHELLRHSLQSSMSDPAGKQLNIRQELYASNDRLRADPARLQQVFWNLLRNAIKFTPNGGSITVGTRNLDDTGQLIIEITDSGVGIPADVLPRIFDAFEQGELRMTRQFGGLGLGLAIAKAVVEMHQGSITAASAGRNQGTTFIVQLETMPAFGAAEAPSSAGVASTRQDLNHARVLLVEDHPDTSRALAKILRARGYQVRTADSVASALHLAAGETFDIVVSDIGLPDATGYDLMSQIRDRHGIKGIALSGYGMEEDMRKSREAGFVDHVVKPVNVSQLAAVIQRVMENHSG